MTKFFLIPALCNQVPGNPIFYYFNTTTMTFVETLRRQKFNAKDDVLSGLTVALALVPEAVAFSLNCTCKPFDGFIHGVYNWFNNRDFGGRPGMISGATGAIAVVTVSLVISHGVEYLFAAVVLMGLIQMTIGFLKLGKFIRLVPHPVILDL